MGAGGRLRIANNNTDYTLIGTTDVDGSTNTAIIISGSSRVSNAGNIQYVATGSGGSHLLYTTVPTTLQMTVASTGVNIVNNLCVSGNVGFGTVPSTTHRVDVLGDVNVSGVFRVGGVTNLRYTGFLGIRGWLKSNCLNVVRVEISTPSHRRPVPYTHKFSFCHIGCRCSELLAKPYRSTQLLCPRCMLTRREHRSR